MEHWYRLRNQVLALMAMLSALAAPNGRAANAQDASEDDAWRQAQTIGTAEAYEGYLRRFPLGRYTREAYRCAVVVAARQQAPGIDIINPPDCAVAPDARSSSGASAGGPAAVTPLASPEPARPADADPASPLGRLY